MRILVTCEAAPKAGPYVEALRAAGFDEGDLCVILPRGERADWQRLGAQADGILLCGGPDVEPWRYGEEPLAGAELDLLPELDEIELGILAGARSGAVPVFGVCRGLQVVNVFLGGTLYQDLPLQLGEDLTHSLPRPKDALAHGVEVHPVAHPFAAALTEEPLAVNSRHHQAIHELSLELTAIASSRDGVVEAVARPRDGWWVDAVQWHPENLLDLPRHRLLFERFRCAVMER